MADDDFGPNGVYSNIPRLDSRGRPQLPMFLRWNPDPVGNDATNLAALNPDMQKVIAQARADNPDLNFVIGNGKRSAQDQDQAKNWGWSRVGSQDGGDANVHMQGNAVDLWGVDSKGRVQFDPAQQKQISQAMQAAAQKLGVGVNWGGNWKSFKDAPHFELAGGGSAQASGAPEGPTSTNAAPAATPAPSQPFGKTINSNVIDTLSRNIASIESGGWKNPYEAVGPVVPGGRGSAIGKYQVMPENIPGWTMAALGKSMTPEEFKASPSAQEAVMHDQMQRGLQLYGPKDVASIYFTGKPFNVAGGGASDRYTTNASYVARATAGLPDTGAAPSNAAPPLPAPSALARPFTPTPVQAPGPMDPSAQAGGPGAPLGTPGSTVNPPIPTTPGLTINSNPIASLGGKIGDLAGSLQKDLGKSDDDKAQPKPEIKPDIPPAPGARNISPLLGNPQIYAQRMAALNQPMTWGSAPPGQNPWAGYGPQNQPVYGTSLMSNLQMLNDPTWMDQMAGGGSYG